MTRILDAAAVVRDGGAVGGWAAAYRRGVRILDGRDRLGRDLPVLLHTVPGHQVRQRAGILPTRCRLLPGEIGWYDDDSVAILDRALYDEMRLAPSLTEAVVVLDMGVSRLTGDVRTSIDSVRRLVERHVKTRGIVQAREALELASERSCSPLESRTRVVAGDALPSVVWQVNRPVFDSQGRLLGIADLIDPVTGLVVESDGRQHREDDRLHAADNIREEGMEDANLTVVRVSSRDHRDPVATAGRIQRGYRRARARDVSRDRWTLVEPDWWPRSRLGQVWA